MRKLLIYLHCIFLISCRVAPDDGVSTFITPHHGKIEVSNVNQFDSLYKLSFAGFEGLYYRFCDTLVAPCYKLIPWSENLDSYYQVEKADATTIFDRVKQLQITTLRINFYSGQHDTTVFKLLQRAYEGQGYVLSNHDTIIRPKYYSDDVMEHTIFGTKDKVQIKLCKFRSSTSTGLVSQIEILNTR